jgi:hypothetical protein
MKRYGLRNFAGIAISRRYYEFLRNQSEVDYDPLILWQEKFVACKDMKINYDYLSHLEETYGLPTLWPYVYADRDLVTYNATFYSHEDLLKLLQGHFKFTVELLEETRPDFIVMPLVDNMEMLVLHEVARHSGIPTLIVTSARVRDRVTISRGTFEGFEKVHAIYEKLLEGNYHSGYQTDAVNFVKEFRTREQDYGDYVYARYLHQRKLSSMFQSPGRLTRRALRYWYNYHFGFDKYDYMHRDRPLSRMALDELKMRFRSWLININKVFELPTDGERYVFYPLHYEPEMSTMVLAPFYVNQTALIENMAKSLPVGYKLYVKEHPLMIGARPVSYYRSLSKIPDVRLIDPSASPYELIKNARLVIVITGTVGWEALLLEKPVITLGRVFYNRLEAVGKARSANSLPELINEMLREYKHNEEQLITYVAAILEGSFSMRFAELTYEEDLQKVLASPDMDILVDALAEEMGLVLPNRS